jgi:hypothetical protein
MPSVLLVLALIAQDRARYHHTHFNSVDPSAPIDFYTTHFNGEKAKFANTMDAVRTGKSWLLFDKVPQPPPSEIVAAIYHIGWALRT